MGINMWTKTIKPLQHRKSKNYIQCKNLHMYKNSTQAIERCDRNKEIVYLYCDMREKPVYYFIT